MDRSVRPQDDLFRYVNGTWLAQDPDPGRQEPLRLVRRACASGPRPTSAGSSRTPPPAASPTPTPRRSATTTRPTWTRHASSAWGSRRSRPTSTGSTRSPTRGRPGPVLCPEPPVVRGRRRWRCSSGPTPRTRTGTCSRCGSRGPGSPDRSYYPRGPVRRRPRRVPHLHRDPSTTWLAGQAAPERPGRVLDLETRLAEAQWTRIQNRDPEARYNPTATAGPGPDVPQPPTVGRRCASWASGRSPTP